MKGEMCYGRKNADGGLVSTNNTPRVYSYDVIL